MNGKHVLRLLLALAAAAAVVSVGRSRAAHGAVREALGWIESLGSGGPAAFIALYAAACVLFIPGSLITLGAGALFGVVWGSVYVSAGSVLGAVAAFLVGRHLARDWVAARVASEPRFAAIDAAIGREGWKIVGLLRLSPLFPFNLLNYALGITQVRLRDYVLASWIGMMPGTVLYVYLGSLAGDLAGAAAGGRGRSPAEWALYAGGLGATAAVTVLITRLARKALSEIAS